jgi:hypothetical protein
VTAADSQEEKKIRPDGTRVGLNVTDDPLTIAGKNVPGRAVRPL